MRLKANSCQSHTWFFRFCVCLCALPIGVLADTHLAARDAVLWRSNGPQDTVSDVLILPNGEACVLFARGGPFIVDPANGKRAALAPGTPEKCLFLRMFVAPDNKGVLVVTRRENVYRVWLCSAGEWRQVQTFEALLRNTVCSCSRDGTVWIHSGEGAVWRVNSDTCERYSYAKWIDQSKRRHLAYKPLRWAECADGTMSFFHTFSFTNSGKSSKKLHVYTKNGWKTLPCEDIHPGGGVYAPDGKLWLASEVGITTFDPSLTKREQLVGPPQGAEGLQRPSFMCRLPDGTIVTLWSQTASQWCPPFLANGAYTRIVEYDKEGWRSDLLSADMEPWRTHLGERPAVIDSRGALWLASKGGGVLRRDPDGIWTRLDWSGGMHARTPVRLAVGEDCRRLWVVGRSGYGFCIDIAKAFGASKSQSPWRCDVLACRMRWTSEDRPIGVSGIEGGCVVELTSEGPRVLHRLPADMPASSVRCMGLDSEGGIWVFPENTLHSLAYCSGGKLQVFKGSGAKDERLISMYRSAYEPLAVKGSGFRIEALFDYPFLPAISDDRRIVFLGGDSDVHYYNGERWFVSHCKGKAIKGRLRERPFFHAGKVTARIGDHFYQMEEDDWMQQAKGTGGQWRRIDSVPHQPFVQPIDFNGTQDFDVPADCPIVKPIWKRIFDGWVWVAGIDRIACSPGEGWLTLQTAGSPLAMGRSIWHVKSAPDGTWFFNLRQIEHAYAIYKGEPLQVDMQAMNLGTVDDPFAVLRPGWPRSSDEESIAMRYRFDNGDWSGLVPAAEVPVATDLMRGEHTLTVQYFGRTTLARSKSFTHRFSVTFAVEEALQALIDQLGAAEFALRDEAYQRLLRFGRTAIPQLEAASTTDDPEVAISARNLIKAIRGPEAKQ